MQDYHNFLDEVLIPTEQLQARITELARQVNEDYQGKNLHMICILRGGMLFLADLMRQIELPHTIDFMAVSSYGSGARQSTGQVRIALDLKEDIHDRDVLLVEDIVDTGYTLRTILDLLRFRGARSVRLCALLDKASRRQVEVPIDYCGFVIEDHFVVGYGLDHADLYRNLPYVGIYEPPPEET